MSGQECDILADVIIDRLGNMAAAAWLPPRIRQALDYLRTTDLASAALGRHDLDGDRLFALIQEYTTRHPDDCAWEAHRKYTDVQYVVSGVERIGYANLAHCRERVPYDADRDVALFEPGADFLTLAAGTVAILGPQDVHAPGCAAGAARSVRKVVVKAAVSD